MAEDQTQTGGAGQQGTGVASGQNPISKNGIIVDPNKTTQQYIEDAESKYIVPALVREKFPDLVKLIFETESMDNEEREYWLQIMPIMTEEQIVKFRNILVNEKEQLARLDAEYQEEMTRIEAKKAKAIDEEKLKEKMQEIKQAEAKAEASEEQQGEDLLKELEDV